MTKSKRKRYHGHELRRCPYCGLRMISRKKLYEYHVNMCAKSAALMRLIGKIEERGK